MSKLTLQFTPEKETTGTFKFAEVVEGDNEPKVGTLYVRKLALDELGWGESAGNALSVTIEIA